MGTTPSKSNVQNACHSQIKGTGDVPAENENIILNPTFNDGVNNWSGRGCKILVQDSTADGTVLPKSGKHFASATDRTESWNGIQQDITGRVQQKLSYQLSAVVRIHGKNATSANVQATLWVQTPDLYEQYICIANMQATDKNWGQLQGEFLLNCNPSKVVVYLEGPPRGTDILLDSLSLKHAEKILPLPAPGTEKEWIKFEA
ncbi:endo-1,4-beta-xylanase 1-like [Apium graveolens]|uniref:endo-1,4-beta-xylanase 1-like n=1 Tax=Apium graveolens TaxID=4045 RepID=UPI003D7B491C